MKRMLLSLGSFLFTLAVASSADAPPADLKAPGPLSPADERKSFQIATGFDMSLVAAEPDVIDPVSMCFDARGRMFVCEMRGYPNGGVGTGNESRGRIRLLTDTDGDGVFETARVFAEGLRFPMGITPWKTGVIVAVAPDIVFLDDTDDDGKADKKTVLYTGFNLANIQQMVNSLQWAADGWVHGLAGNAAGTIQSVEKPDVPAVVLQARGFRFQPSIPGSLEPTSGGGQYGITQDDAGHWFTATNSQHLRQIVIPDHYLRRNKNALVSQVTLDIPDHGAAAKVFRISPFEPWRVERTTRRAGAPDARRFPTTELVPGGYITSACSPTAYTAELFAPAFRTSVFVCDPANNLIHRDVLEPNGAVFVARRGETDREFLASTDNWFRPTHLTVGPDGALYLLDFYREVIETPLSLPEDIKARLNLESRERGRIWRIAPQGFKPAKMPDLTKDSPDRLAERLADANASVRTTALRLLDEKGETAIRESAQGVAENAVGKPSLPLVLSHLARSGKLTDERILSTLSDPLPGNREAGLRFAEQRLEKSEPLRRAVAKLADDPSPMVRFQVALTCGFLPQSDATPVLAALIRKDAGDPWMSSAVLCSSRDGMADLLLSVMNGETPPAQRAVVRSFVTRAAAGVGAQGDEAAIAKLLVAAVEGKGKAAGLDLATLDGLLQGTRRKPGGLKALLAKHAERELLTRLLREGRELTDEKLPIDDRVSMVRWLAFAPLEYAVKAAKPFLTPQTPPELQLAAVRAVAAHDEAGVAEALLAGWPQYGPATRREVLEHLLATPARATVLLDLLEKKSVVPGELEPSRVAQLKLFPNAAVKARAIKLLAGQGTSERLPVVKEYSKALELTGRADRGQMVFKQHCAACHKLGDVGHEVGPNLLATLPGKSGEDLLVAVFDPNREVDPRYVNYVASTSDGRSLTGVIVAETAAAVTLRRADGAEDTIRRADIESIRSSGLSLMPEGVEKNATPQDVADLFAYLKQVAAGVPKK